MLPVEAAPGKAASYDLVRVHNETPRLASASERQGCPWVESSRDPWYTPVQVMPDLPCTVPDLPGGRAVNTVELTKEKVRGIYG